MKGLNKGVLFGFLFILSITLFMGFKGEGWRGSKEEVQDWVGAMLGGTETGVSVTYQDATNDIDFVVDTDLQTLAGPTAWRMFYSDAADPFIQQITLGANGTFLESNGASAAPAFRALEDGDIPTTLTLETISGTPAITNGVAIGTDQDANKIDDATNGAGSTQLWIGDEYIVVSGDIGVAVQAQHAALASIVGLTEADVSIIAQTAADTYEVVTSGGNYYMLTSDDDNSDLAFVAPATVRSQLDLEAGTDFYDIASADAAFEGELDDSAGLLAALDDETGTGVAVFGTAPTFTTKITITGADATPGAAGEILYDTTVTGLADGALVWYDQDEARYIVDLAVLPSVDDYIVAYDADNDKFYMKADSGATAWDDIGNPDANKAFDFTDFYTSMDFGDTDHDMFTIELTGAFADVSGLVIEQKTGNPTDGTLLELKLADGETDPDFASYKVGAAEVYNVDAAGKVTALGGVDTGGSATPSFIQRDSDAAGAAAADEYSMTLESGFSTTTEDGEISDFALTAWGAGTAGTQYTHLFWDGSDSHLYMGVLADYTAANPSVAPLDLATYESLVWDFDYGTDTVGVSSPVSGTTTVNWTTLNRYGTGLLAGGVVTNSKAAAYTIGTDNAMEAYGGVIYVTDAAVITYPAVATGMHFTIITIGAVAVSGDPNNSDKQYLDGTLLDDGDKVTNTSTTGDLIVVTYFSADGWYTISGSNDGDPWTDDS